MKALIISLTIFFSVILTTVLVACYTSRLMSELEEAVDKEITESLDSFTPNIEEIESKYRKAKPFLTLFMRDSEVREIEAHIEDVRSAANSRDQDELMAAKSRLMLQIGQIKRLSAFSIEAIF